MAAPAVIQRPASLGLKLAAFFAFLPPLLTRLVIGQAFFLTGRGKLANIEGTTQFFADLGIPMPGLNAAFVSRLEYYGGMLLIIGLLTRLTALMLSSTMVVALMTADRPTLVKAFMNDPDVGFTDITPVMYGMLLLWLVVYGPGLLSLDTLLARWIKPAGEDGAAPDAKAAA